MLKHILYVALIHQITFFNDTEEKDIYFGLKQYCSMRKKIIEKIIIIGFDTDNRFQRKS